MGGKKPFRYMGYDRDMMSDKDFRIEWGTETI